MQLYLDEKQKQFKSLVAQLNDLLKQNKTSPKIREKFAIKVSKSDAFLIESMIGEQLQSQNLWGYPVFVKEEGKPELQAKR